MSVLMTPSPVKRPGCLTAYVLVLWLGGVAYLVLTFMLAFTNRLEAVSAGGLGPFLALCAGVLALLPIITGLGLWRMKGWAWVLVIVFHGLGVSLSLLNLLSSLSLGAGQETVGPLLTAVMGTAVNGGLVYWFAQNRHLFADSPGEIGGAKSAAANRTAVVMFAVSFIILCLVPIVVLAVITLLGPEIGNVFSQITAP